jgi:hypothetical protein
VYLFSSATVSQKKIQTVALTNSYCNNCTGVSKKNYPTQARIWRIISFQTNIYLYKPFRQILWNRDTYLKRKKILKRHGAAAFFSCSS